MDTEKLVTPGIAALVLLGLSFLTNGLLGLLLRIGGFVLAAYYFNTRYKTRKAQAAAQMQKKGGSGKKKQKKH